MSIIKIKRGINSSLPAGGTVAGEPRFSTDTGQLYIDDGTNNIEITPNTTNVTAAGALMDSEVDADIKTLSLPSNTTITAFAQTFLDDTTQGAVQTTLGVDPTGTDNSTDVTLAGVGTYISILGQVITVDAITESDISDLQTYLVASNNLSDLGSATTARTNLGLGTAAVLNTGTGSGNIPILDGAGLINPSVLPALAISETSVVASEVAQLALTVQEGDIAVRTDENKSYIALNDTNATMSDWQELLTPTDAVTSVFGRSGVVTAQTNDYTWAQIDKTTSSLADLATKAISDTTGTLALARGGTGATTASGARTALVVDVAGTDNSTDVSLGGTGTYLSLVGQVLTVDPITESDISDLGAYITDISGSPLSQLSDTTITSSASGELLKWNGTAWINNTLSEAGISATGHSHISADITDFDTEVSNNTSVVDNTAKVTNATHTGQVTGATALTLNKTAISDQTDVTMVATDILLFGDTSDTANLKKGAVQDILDLAGGGGLSWSEVTGTTQAMAVNTGYIANNASLVVATLPTTAAVGDVVRITGKGAGGWKISQNASEIIHFGVVDSTTGTGGSLASTEKYDSVELVCIVANNEWVVISSTGNVTIV